MSTIADVVPEAGEAISDPNSVSWDPITWGTAIAVVARSVRRSEPETVSLDEALIAAEKLYQAEDWEGAALAFGLALRHQPDDASLYARQGLSHYRSGDEVAAETAFLHALKLDPMQASAHAHLLEMATARKDAELLGDLMRMRIEAGGESQALLTDWAARLMRIGHAEDAYDIASKAVARQDVGAYALQLHAMVAFDLGLMNTATRSAERLWQIDRALSNNAIFFAQINLHQGRTASAASILKDSIAAGAHAPLLYRMLSGALVSLGEMRDAARWAVKATRADPSNSEFWYHLSNLAEFLGYKGDSLEFMKRAVGIEPGNAQLSLSLARALVRDGELNQAVTVLDAACTGDSDNQPVRDYRLSILEQRFTDLAPATGGATIKPLPRSQDRIQWGDMHDLGSLSAFLAGLTIQGRVLSALCVRQVSHLSLHSRFGLAAVIIEPLLHVAVMGLVLTYFNHGKPPLGNNLFFYYATGILPFLLFGHITDHSLSQYVDNKNLLHVRLIQRIDFVIASALTLLLVDGAAMFIIFFGFYLFNIGEPVGNGFAALTGFGAMWLLALGFGLVSAALNSVTLLWQKVWYSAQRLLYIASGIFYIPSQLPDWFRDIVVWNPTLIGIEWIRTGFFPQYDPPWVDKTYMLVFAAIMITVGLILERLLRPYARD